MRTTFCQMVWYGGVGQQSMHAARNQVAKIAKMHRLKPSRPLEFFKRNYESYLFHVFLKKITLFKKNVFFLFYVFTMSIKKRQFLNIYFLIKISPIINEML